MKRWPRLFTFLMAVAGLAIACGGNEPDLTAPTVPAEAPTTSVHVHDDGEVHVHTNEATDDESASHDMSSMVEMSSDISTDEHGGHDHSATREVAADGAVPTVSLEVTPDPSSGWNVQVTLGNFHLAPERASTEHVEGEGHMHIYVDGVKINRLYGLWYHLGNLEPGEREVRVELSANDHATLTHNGNPIDATVMVDVPSS